MGEQALEGRVESCPLRRQTVEQAGVVSKQQPGLLAIAQAIKKPCERPTAFKEKRDPNFTRLETNGLVSQSNAMPEIHDAVFDPVRSVAHLGEKEKAVRQDITDRLIRRIPPRQQLQPRQRFQQHRSCVVMTPGEQKILTQASFDKVELTCNQWVVRSARGERQNASSHSLEKRDLTVESHDLGEVLLSAYAQIDEVGNDLAGHSKVRLGLPPKQSDYDKAERQRQCQGRRQGRDHRPTPAPAPALSRAVIPAAPRSAGLPASGPDRPRTSLAEG